MYSILTTTEPTVLIYNSLCSHEENICGDPGVKKPTVFHKNNRFQKYIWMKLSTSLTDEKCP